jgi:hypothetical protein
MRSYDSLLRYGSGYGDRAIYIQWAFCGWARVVLASCSGG